MVLCRAEHISDSFWLFSTSILLAQKYALAYSLVSLFSSLDTSVYHCAQVADKQARITHTHKNGCNGAILQCLAVHSAVTSDAQAPLNKAAYLDFLLEQMDAIESEGIK